MSPNELMEEYKKMNWKDQVIFSRELDRFNNEMIKGVDKLKNIFLDELSGQIKKEDRNKKIDEILYNQ